jgi:hypothetical protein
MTTYSGHEVALRLVADGGPGALSGLLRMYAFLVAGEDGTFTAARTTLSAQSPLPGELHLPLRACRHDAHRFT